MHAKTGMRLSNLSNRRLASFAFVSLLLSGVHAARALTYLTIDDADLADQATAIAEIDVLSMSPAAGTALPSTEYVVLVERVLKGSLDATAVIRVLGGEREDGMRFEVPGAPVFREGEKALVFLAPRPRRRLLRSPFHARRLSSHRRRGDGPTRGARSRCGVCRRRAGATDGRSRARLRTVRHLARRPRARIAPGRGLPAAGDCPDRARDRRALPPVHRQRTQLPLVRLRRRGLGGIRIQRCWFGQPGERPRRVPAGPRRLERRSRVERQLRLPRRHGRRQLPRVGPRQRRRVRRPQRRDRRQLRLRHRRHARDRRRALRRLDRPLRRRPLAPHPRGRHRGAGRHRLRAPEQRAADRRDPHP